MTPQAPSWIQSPYQQLAGKATGLLSMDPTSFTTPATANQRQAWARAGAGPNMGVLNEGINATRGLLDFNPQQIGQVNAVNGGAASTVAGPNQSDYVASTVTPQSLLGMDLSGYMNPFQRSVIDETMAGLERDRQGAISVGQGNATMSGAYGGSRHGVADAITNKGFLDTAALTRAQLGAANYNQAVQGAQFDIGTKLGADTFNAGATNDFRKGFLSDDIATKFANQAAQESATGRQFTADTNAQQLNQQGALANQQAGMQAQQMKAQAAQQLASLGLSQMDQERLYTQLLSQMGEEERAILSQTDPEVALLSLLQAGGGLLGQIPSQLFTGQTGTLNGTTTTTTKESPGLLDILGTAAQAAGAFTGNPFLIAGGGAAKK